MKYSDTVIVTNGKYRTSANWTHNTWTGWYGWLTDGEEELKGITHWMPLPAPPTSSSSEFPNNCKKFDIPGYENVIIHEGNTKGGEK